MISAINATVAVDSRCDHGEGVLWCERRQALFWVDISAKQIWRYDPASAQRRQWTVPDRPGCLGLLDDGRLLVALAKSIGVVDPDAPAGPLSVQPLVTLETDNPHTRSNDGRADRHGNFVFGTMDENEHKAARGAFYQFSLRHGLRRLSGLGGVSIPNSICFSHDGRTLYYCDSVQPRILCCDYDPERAETGQSRLFAVLDHDGAEPDGSIIDADGYLWNAQWRARRVVRYRPDGRPDRTIILPVKHPTCCAFGGTALDRLYITSSRQDHSAAELLASNEAGHLFQCLPNTNGMAESRIASA